MIRVAISSIVVRRSTGSVLFIKREKDPNKGKLSYPGGRVEKGESLIEAMVRETFEETGFKIKEYGEGLPLHKSEYKVKDLHYIIYVSLFELNDEKRYTTSETDLIEYKWIKIDEILDNPNFDQDYDAIGGIWNVFQYFKRYL